MDFCCRCLPGNDAVHQTLSFFIDWERNTTHNWWFILLMKGSLRFRLFVSVMGKLLLQWKTLRSLRKLKITAASLWRDFKLHTQISELLCLIDSHRNAFRRARCTQRNCNREIGAKYLCEKKQDYSTLCRASAKFYLEAEIQTLNLQTEASLAPKDWTGFNAGFWRWRKIANTSNRLDHNYVPCTKAYVKHIPSLKTEMPSCVSYSNY